MDKFMPLFGITTENIVTHETWKFFDGAKLVGLITLDFNNPELINLYIDPAYIGKGVGTQLWNFAATKFKEIKAQSFKIWADPNADGFYRRMGAAFLYKKLSPMGKDRFTSVFEFKV